MTLELLERREGDCGCPEEVYLFDGFLDLVIHYEPNGDVDAHLDWGDDDAIFTGRSLEAVLTWVRSLFK